VSFDDGAIDAGGQAKIVGVEDEATHRNESSSLGVAKKLCEMQGKPKATPQRRELWSPRADRPHHAYVYNQ
jgi:hypothetical protein